MRILVLCLFLLLSFYSNAQKVSFGISMGITSDELKVENDFSLNSQVKSFTTEQNPGFNLGIQSLIPIANRVKLSPQLILAFSKHSYSFEIGNDESSTRSIENVFIRTPIDLHLELLKGEMALYLISGIEYAYNITDDNTEGSLLNIQKGFWSGRLGLGIRKDFAKFSISPELTYAKTFSDIQEGEVLPLNQVITNLDNSILGLSLKFQGLLSDD